MPAVRPEIKRLVMEQVDLAQHDPGVLDGLQIHKLVWLKHVIRRFRKFKIAYAELALTCLTDWIASCIEEFIRFSKDSAVESIRDLDEIVRHLKTKNRMVQIQLADGRYLVKRERDCSPDEFDRLAEQYERGSAALARRGRYYRAIAQQMRLKGLANDEPLSKYNAS